MIQKLRMSINFSVALLALSGLNMAFGESINVDFSSFYGAPDSSFGAVGQPGHWNSVDPGSSLDPPIPLLGLDGSATSVTLSFPHFKQPGDGYTTTPVLPPNTSELVEDFLVATDILLGFEISGLDDGSYDLYLYGSNGDLPTAFLVESGPSFQMADLTGGWNGSFEEGVNYNALSVDVVGGLIDINFVASVFGSFAGVSGVQLVQVPEPSGLSLMMIPLALACIRRSRSRR